jgi:predicted nucleic acid-binding protein
VSVPTALIDSNIALYALGSESEWREACRHVLVLLAQGTIAGVASTEMLQEVAHHRLRMTGSRSRAVADTRDVMALVATVDFDEAVLHTALHLIESTGIRGRDAVHAATALTQGVDRMISIDPAFDTIPGLTRVTPAGLDEWIVQAS